MFKKGEKVIYPKHGAGKIVDIYKEAINSKLEEYYRIQFFNSPTTVCVPAYKACELGLRYPLTRSELRKFLHRLGKEEKITRNTLVSLDEVTKKRLNSGRLEDVIGLVNLLHSLAKRKEEENKNFSYSYSDRLEVALDFIKSEVALVLGERALKRYKLF